MKKNNIIEFCYELSLSVLLFIFNILFISSLFFVLKISISKINFYVSLILTLTLIGFYFFKKGYGFFKVVIRFVTFLLILFLSIFVASKCYDLTWDGNSYHKTAIGELKNGWNPLYQDIGNFNSSKENKNYISDTHDIWTDHYAKGHWIFAANIYSLTNNIESGKSINFLLVISLFLLSVSFLLRYTSKLFAFLVSLIIVFNPVSIVQISCFYNDILIYNLIVIEMIFIQLILFENKKESYLGLLLTLCILINIKFTGLAYGAIVMLIYYIPILVCKKFRNKYLKQFTVLGILSVLIGICFIGSSTYLKNIKYENNPLYPLFGENKVDIMTQNQPKIFSEMNKAEKFIYANFSTLSNITFFQDENPTLKIPFTYSQTELYQLIVPDLRIGGFGPLFGGILLISLIIIIIGLYFLFKKDRNLFIIISLLLLSIIIFVIVLDEAWWARYLPQLYLLPVIALYLLYYFNYRKINVFLSFALVVVLILNCYYIFDNNTFQNLKKYKVIDNQLSQIKSCTNCEVYTKDFSGAIYNLYDVNNSIKVLNEPKVESGDIIYNNMLYIYSNKDK